MKKSAKPIVNGRNSITPISTNLLTYALLNSLLRCYFHFVLQFLHFRFSLYQLKDVATENFQRVCEAYEVLSDPNKRQVYDVYGMEGLKSGLELGPSLDRDEEIKAELDRPKRMRDQEKRAARI